MITYIFFSIKNVIETIYPLLTVIEYLNSITVDYYSHKHYKEYMYF